MRSIASVSTWPWAPAPSSATLISCRSGGGDRRRRRPPRLFACWYARCCLPRVAEEAERGDRGQPLQHVAPVELLRPLGCGLRLLLPLSSSPAIGSSPVMRSAPSIAFAGRAERYVADGLSRAGMLESHARSRVRDRRSGAGPRAWRRPSGRIQASSPGLRSHSASISFDAQQHEGGRQGVGHGGGARARGPLGRRVGCGSPGRGTATQAASRPRTGSPVRGSTM